LVASEFLKSGNAPLPKGGLWGDFQDVCFSIVSRGTKETFRMKIHRNDPCMCGSGKKYKHCCGKDGSRLEASRSREKDHFISEPVPKAGNMPHFSKEFFTGLEPDDKICVYKLIYSSLLSPKLAEAASKVSNRLLERGRYEAGKIKACSSARGLIEMMTGGIDPLNHVLFRKKVLEIQEETIPLLLGKLRKPTNDEFVELSVRILVGTRINVAQNLMDIVSMRDKSVYQLAVLCLALGFFEHSESVQFLWNHFCCFQSKFPEKNYWRGPFYGLWENWAREEYGRIPSFSE
jgi:hypothetical protein